MSETDYPKGDGRPDCKHCKGRGVVPVPSDKRPPNSIGELTQPCSCVLVRDVLTNLNRGWKGLAQAPPIDESPLRGKTEQNLWITGSTPQLQQHVRHVAVRMGPRWQFQVVPDAVMMDAWLSKDVTEVWDPDIEAVRRSVSNRYAQLSDLVDPPELLIIQLGVKAARNKAMPEVLLEALNRRCMMQTDRPTWVMDQPIYPLAEGHICYSDRVAELLAGWEHIDLEEMEGSPEPEGNGVHILTLGQGGEDGFENRLSEVDTSDSSKGKRRRKR